MRPLRALIAAALVLWLGGCALLKPKCDCPRDEKVDEKAKVDPHSGLPQQRVILNEGYSELYADMTHMDEAQLIFDVKSGSDTVKDIFSGVGHYAAHVKEELERLAKEYPALRIDLDPLPEMEKRKRHSIAIDRAKEYAPLVGKGGLDFERRALLSLHGGIDHQRHMCKVLAEEEPEPGLKKFLLDTEQHFDAWYERIQVVLDRDYFRQPKTPAH
jgi:hypothetical protein